MVALLSRFDRLQAPVSVGAKFNRFAQTRDRLPADVQSILALSPDVYFDLRFPALPGIGQILWQDAARTTEVDTAGQAIGSARNLGSLGGFATSSGTQRPLWREDAGAEFDGVDDQLVSDWTDVQAQPVTHVMFFRSYRWTSSNRYAFGSATGTALRHDTGIGAAFGAFPNGHLLNHAGTLNRIDWGLGTDNVDTSRVVWRVDGASTVQDWSGDWTYTTGTYNAGSNGQAGIALGNLIGTSTHGEMTSPVYARFPRILTAGELATLPGVL